MSKRQRHLLLLLPVSTLLSIVRQSSSFAPHPFRRRSKSVNLRGINTNEESSGQSDLQYTERSGGEDQLISRSSRRDILKNAIVQSTFFGLGCSFFEKQEANAAQAMLPDLGEISAAIPATWDIENPFQNSSSASASSDFARLDSSPDSKFYAEARFVEHVDENSVKLMTEYIANNLKQGDSVLDIGSSWTSHIDKSIKGQLSRVAGLGMNKEELSTNPSLTESAILDLNSIPAPELPYADNSFDVVLCQLSIDYFTHPLELMKEVSRVLKSNGRVIILFSNRLFLSKAVGVWTGADDIDHTYIVGAYLHYSGGAFEEIKAEDLSTRKRGKVVGDPLYVVTARKS